MCKKSFAIVTLVILDVFTFYIPRANAQALERVRTKGGVEMVLLAGGSYVMGDKNENIAGPPHEVFVSPFYIDITPVTQQEYVRLMGKNTSKFIGMQQPVEQIRWSDAVRYCNERSREEGLDLAYNLSDWTCDYDANGYRLPTEAEWEYAARANTTTAYFHGNDPGQLSIYAWYIDNSGGKPHPVGKRRPNPWGLHDMSGNIWEWCNDFYHPDYYKSSPSNDPRGPQQGEEKVLRGGCWNSNAISCRVSYRYSEYPGYTDACFGYDIYGFRVVRPKR